MIKLENIGSNIKLLYFVIVILVAYHFSAVSKLEDNVEHWRSQYNHEYSEKMKYRNVIWDAVSCFDGGNWRTCVDDLNSYN